ncbi:substrate-binding domain-containing protein [Pelotomaculum propionicicum]|uniref:substrate-binding domain-containing protein n=1 Tax=Pelotomaculum propionicicum TaxID=258475 RepID=UPI003B762ABF
MLKHRYKLIFLVVAVITFALILAAGCAKQESKETAAAGGQILLASTIGPIDAGIVSALEDSFEKKTGIRVRHVGAGTGAALKMAESGTFDLVMVHAKALEEKFVADGFGTKRIDLMYNDFVIIGPESDPAQIKGLKTSAEALKKIMDTQSLFISRGDNSGTHVAEKDLWKAAGLSPSGDWYRIYEKGSEGNVKTLKYTDEQQGYTIIDRATYLTVKNNIKLKVLVEKEESLLNYISFIPVNPERFPNVKNKLAMQFVEFCTSAEGQTIIRDFGKDKYGEPLFYPNSAEGKALSK